MKKPKTVMKNTDNSRVYKMARRQYLPLICPICPPNKGCNRFKCGNEYRSWKYWRKTQYRINKNSLKFSQF